MNGYFKEFNYDITTYISIQREKRSIFCINILYNTEICLVLQIRYKYILSRN